MDNFILIVNMNETKQMFSHKKFNIEWFVDAFEYLFPDATHGYFC
jgi:hypothetical protein